MRARAQGFPRRAREALIDDDLRSALDTLKGGMLERRRLAFEQLPEHQAIRNWAREVKDHTLAHLDYYLEQFEANVQRHGGHVHWASTPDEAAEIVVAICREAEAKRVTKGITDETSKTQLSQPSMERSQPSIETDLMVSPGIKGQ